MGIQINLSAAPWSWTWQLQSSEKGSEKLRYSLKCGLGSGKHQQRVGAGFMLAKVVTRNEVRVAERRSGEGSWRNPHHSGRRVRD